MQEFDYDTNKELKLKQEFIFSRKLCKARGKWLGVHYKSLKHSGHRANRKYKRQSIDTGETVRDGSPTALFHIFVFVISIF